MQRVAAIAGSVVFLAIGPGTICVLVPWWISRWHFESSPFGLLPVRILGAGLIAVGAAVLLDSFARFAVQGQGTPAPVVPTDRLVVTGPYRYMRNPMYVAVVVIIAGQGFMFANVWLLVYGAIVWLGCHLFVVLYEEPTLRARYGTGYESYCASVPRWITRSAAWPGVRSRRN